MAESKKQRLILVTGKGGVGKSVSAAALAWREAQRGNRVLLVELGEESFYQDFFKLPEVSFKPNSLAENLDVAIWSSGNCLREYALHLLRSENLYHLFFENLVMKTFIKVAPGLTELAILGKFTSGIRNVGPALNYDVIVMDSFASGHTTALLKAPRGMAEAVRIGPMGEQSRSILKVMSDPNHSSYFVVTLPEELPFQECLELVGLISEETKIKPEIICNNLLEEPLPIEELEKMPVSPELESFTKYLSKRIRQQKEIVKNLMGLGMKTHSVSQLLETDSWELVKGVAKRLEP